MNSQKHSHPLTGALGEPLEGSSLAGKQDIWGCLCPTPSLSRQAGARWFPRGGETTSPPLHSHPHMHTFHMVRMPCEMVRPLSLGVCKSLVMILH